MARLNEAPPPAESVDSLKRRFIRQNRELAKTNSNQSVRIRSLENEQARILHENFRLHEEIIRLQAELERTRGDNAMRHVNAVKDKLDAKVEEISGLIAELSAIKNPARPSNPEPSQVTTDIFEWKRAMRTQAKEEQVEDLPTIQEDKQYPRRTLNAEEIQAVIAGSAEDSPDLGPPPVAHFQEEDPIKFDPIPATEESEPQRAEETELPIISTVNLETRRRRRDSAKLDLRKVSVFQVPEEEAENAKRSEGEDQAMRTGTKRKLSFTTEELQEDANIDVREDFRVSRRGVSGRSADKSSSLQPLDIKQNSKLDMLVAAERKALGDKTNTSPKKVMRSSSAEDKPEGKKPSALAKDSIRSRVKDRRTKSSQIVQIPPLESEGVVETKDVVIPEDSQPVEHHPKTPAGLDLFSPTFNEPSVQTRETKDTPPPTDLVSGGLESQQSSRPSRRARPQINYAEPNLVSKMRRPDKKLADAVADGRRSSIASREEDNSAPSSSTAMRTVVIKKERESGGSGFKTLAAENQPEPASPLGDKMAAVYESQSQTNVGPAQQPAKTVQFEDEVSTARESGSAPTKTTRRRTTKHQASSDLEKDPRRDLQQELAIFDICQSSPENHEQTNEEIMKSSRELAKKTSRRHSTMTDMPSRTRDKEETLSKSKGDQTDDEGKKKAIRELKQGRTSTRSGETTTGDTSKTSKNSSRRRSMMI
ncbi:hypothetical protein BKA81DRAFT_398428 [Phyllosticta paracitricarpa]|uniref:Shugoshin n=1 Tax=Phyllosticta paracitricarpa TaxID=2016321 RepID=A0ABR1MXN7_9PEZI